MNPAKEKAKEIYLKYHGLTDGHGNCKTCAAIAINEKISTLRACYPLMGTSKSIEELEQYKELQKIRAEIGKL